MTGIGGQILGLEIHNQTAVGIALIAGVLAHAVRHNPPLLRGRADNKATRAHAEAVDAATVLGVVDKFVFSGSQSGMPGVVPPAGLVDQLLWVLDPQAN